MVLLSRYHKNCKVAFLRVGFIAIALSALFIPSIEGIKHEGNNIFTLYINDTLIGTVDTEETADELLNEARRAVVADADDLVLIEAETRVEGSEVLYGKTDDEAQMVEKIKEVYTASLRETMQHSYTVKIDDYSVNVSTAEDVEKLLEASINRYADPGDFTVDLIADSDRKLPVLIPRINKTAVEVETGASYASDYLGSDGIFYEFDKIIEEAVPATLPSFDDYTYGITDVAFANNVEVVESYLSSSKVVPLSAAIDEVTKDKEQKTIYVVVAGDSLSLIAQKTGISVDQIIELNENITSANSLIRVGDEITVTVPEPELSIRREELVYYEGTYEADVIYKYNDNWYTTTEVTLQEPSSGYHKAVEKVTYLNSKAIDSEVVMEEIVAEAIPKIVEKGTKIPPTYIKPISGGRLTSTFGGRSATIRGMTTYHGAVDWATPIGTSVVASCGGRVSFAGWKASYGNCIFIEHPDGRQTRYAHLSKVLVSAGQNVSQGEKIALSGNTGVSTGPHLHFEIRIGGKAVDPLKYISY